MSSPADERAELFAAFNHQSQLLAATVVLFEQAVADRLQLSVSHVHVANLLRLTGPMTAGQLAELTGLTTGSVTSMVDRLVRAGYVRRESDPHDRRRVVVRADADAMERDVGALYESLAHASARLIAGYSTEELALLVGHLTRNNALMLEEAVKLRHSTVARAEASSGEELSGSEVVVPLGAVEAGHLVVTTGATRLILGGHAGSEELFRAHFGKLAPSVLVEGGLVKVFYRQALLNWSANSADIQLNPRVPWRLDLVSSGASCRADLRAIILNGLEVNVKASSVELVLPSPTMSVPVRIAGSASTVVLRRPRGTGFQLRLQHGVANVTVDGEVLEAAPGRPYQTTAYAAVGERYEIEVTARLTTVQIETSE
jgi:DNA-binding MarR family transcriptional regulator